MPLATIYVKDPRKTPNITELAQALPGLVAKHLTCGPDTPGSLAPNEVEARVQVGHPLDQGTKDVQIIVWANLYPERLENLDERRTGLTMDVLKLVPQGMSGFVWILLQPGSYEEWSEVLAGRDFTTDQT